MSNRTAKANKAVEEAWKREKELVSQGLGTRDWTPEEQESILDRGKAYDAQHKAYQGHHMKSVEKYPEHQGDSGDIQFLSLAEHRAAHGGDFHNPTNGYYDPITGITKDFGDGAYEPCKTIELTSPVRKITEIKVEHCINEERSQTDGSRINQSQPRGRPVEHQPSSHSGTRLKRFFTGVGTVTKKVGTFCFDNRDTIIPFVIESAAKFIPSIVSGAMYRDTSSHEFIADSGNVIKDMGALDNAPTKVGRASPMEHEVCDYFRIQNGKKVHVSNYKRGGKKNV